MRRFKNLTEDEEKLILFVSSWWERFLRKYNLTEEEIKKLISELLKRLADIYDKGYVLFATDSYINETLDLMLKSCGIDKLLPSGVEMMITPEKVILKEGEKTKSKIIYENNKSVQSDELGPNYNKK